MEPDSKKELMESYEGIKFETVQLSATPPAGLEKLYPLFKACAEKCNAHEMVPQNAGNFSMRFEDGIVITAGGSNLAALQKEDLVFVSDCSIAHRQVQFKGTLNPSSETFVHYQVYLCRSDVSAIVHAHNIPDSCQMVGIVEETPREEPYGTLAFADVACDTLGGDRQVIVLKNHGYLAVGKSLADAGDLMIRTHLECCANL